VALLLAAVIGACQLSRAWVTARKTLLGTRLASHRLGARSLAVAGEDDLLGARRALARMAVESARVLAAVEGLAARAPAELLLGGAALDRVLALAARTGADDEGRARSARSRMAKVGAAVRTLSISGLFQRLAADLAARVGRLSPVVGRVDHLATEAAVFEFCPVGTSLAAGTPPSIVVGVFFIFATLHFYPLLDAVDMKYLETLLLAVPGCVCRLDLF